MGDPGLGQSQIHGIEQTVLPTEEVSVLVTGFGVSGVPGDHLLSEARIANLVPDKGTSRLKPMLPMPQT